MPAWVAAHTGLPSFYYTTPTRVVAPDGRVLADGTKAPVMVSDALAEPGQDSTYTVGSSTVTLRRTDAGHAIADKHGRNWIQVAWLGTDETNGDPRVSLLEVSQRRTPLTRWKLKPSTLAGRSILRADGAKTAALNGLLSSRGPIILLYSPSGCDIPGCDIPPVRLVVVRAFSSQRSPRIDKAARIWTIDWQEYASSEASGAAPILTWQDYIEHLSPTWHPNTTVNLLRQIAGMP